MDVLEIEYDFLQMLIEVEYEQQDAVFEPGVIRISLVGDEKYKFLALKCYGEWGVSEIFFHNPFDRSHFLNNAAIEIEVVDFMESFWQEGEQSLTVGRSPLGFYKVFYGESPLEFFICNPEDDYDLDDNKIVEDQEVDLVSFPDFVQIKGAAEVETLFKRRRRSLLVEEQVFPLHKQWKNLKKNTYDTLTLTLVLEVMEIEPPRELGVGFRQGDLLLLKQGREYDFSASIYPT